MDHRDQIIHQLMTKMAKDSAAQGNMVRDYLQSVADALCEIEAHSNPRTTKEAMLGEAKEAAQRMAVGLGEWTTSDNTANAAGLKLGAAALRRVFSIMNYDGEGPCPGCGEQHDPMGLH